MNGAPPWANTASMFSTLRYALSADTSLTVKFLAVALTSGLNCGQSAASRSRISTAVTTCVLTPQAMWHFTQVLPERWTPYFSSNHRTNRLLLNPVESTANSVSTPRGGKAGPPSSCLQTDFLNALPRHAPH